MATQSFLLKQVRLIDPLSGSSRILDVHLANGKIQSLAPNLSHLPVDTQTIDANGKILGPGLVDLYSHSGEPGHEERETLSSLLASASAGGFTRITILPNTTPPLDNPDILASLKQKTYGGSTTLQFWGALTLAAKGEQMNEIAQLVSSVVGFADNKMAENLSLLRRLLEYLQPLGKPIALYPCFASLKGNGIAREGPTSFCLGLPGDPEISETTALAAVLELVNSIKCPVHIMRVSTARGVELISQAKTLGLPVTASTTWLHLLQNTQDLADYNTSLRLEPPLGNESDMQALIQGIKTGVIDAIASDHRAYTFEEKTVAFALAPPGAIGLQLVLPLLWQHLVVTGHLTPLQLWRLLSTSPQLCLGQTPTPIAEGQKAELTLFDPEQIWIANQDNLKSICHNTSWLGKEITGCVVQIWN